MLRKTGPMIPVTSVNPNTQSLTDPISNRFRKSASRGTLKSSILICGKDVRSFKSDLRQSQSIDAEALTTILLCVFFFLEIHRVEPAQAGYFPLEIRVEASQVPIFWTEIRDESAHVGFFFKTSCAAQLDFFSQKNRVWLNSSWSIGCWPPA